MTHARYRHQALARSVRCGRRVLHGAARPLRPPARLPPVPQARHLVPPAATPGCNFPAPCTMGSPCAAAACPAARRQLRPGHGHPGHARGRLPRPAAHPPRRAVCRRASCCGNLASTQQRTPTGRAPGGEARSWWGKEGLQCWVKVAGYSPAADPRPPAPHAPAKERKKERKQEKKLFAQECSSKKEIWRFERNLEIWILKEIWKSGTGCGRPLKKKKKKKRKRKKKNRKKMKMTGLHSCHSIFCTLDSLNAPFCLFEFTTWDWREAPRLRRICDPRDTFEPGRCCACQVEREGKRGRE